MWKSSLGHPISINRNRIVRLERIHIETPSIKSFSFHDSLCATAKPGQFIMVWVIGTDEVPMSLSTIQPNGYSEITVAKVGEATAALHQKQVGDFIGVRGPYGNGFTPSEGKLLLVGGGTGIAVLWPLAATLARQDVSMTFVLGAKTRDELLFLDRVQSLSSKHNYTIAVTTEDGSLGSKGVATDKVENLLERSHFDMIYTCGPESMMRRVFQLAELYNIPLQASLERIMKCGLGICGSCCVGKYRVCKDGPVFSSKQLKEILDEFGLFKRDFSGKKISY
ncbi:dihydroorotate dehydrogenase electron transfer subunit [Candidatus Bathyarchaeota archaeon]|nr:dihydroorotate dehydrogenase electron transfer subunit [Candidatus Bathyarchaeota archaeon]